jgi:16S rRNA (guanine966-N2)-methyltransferase
VRIIRGKYRGRQIHAPKSLPVRPTTDYAKEGLFNILEHTFDFESLEVLDLFAGTGSISYEFASRGCKSILAVDHNYHCTSFIKETARKLDISNLQVVKMDVMKVLAMNNKPYSLIFADPPYSLGGISALPEAMLNARHLYGSGWLVLEHSSAYDFAANPHYLEKRKYGEVNFSFFEFSAVK